MRSADLGLSQGQGAGQNRLPLGLGEAVGREHGRRDAAGSHPSSGRRSRRLFSPPPLENRECDVPAFSPPRHWHSAGAASAAKVWPACRRNRQLARPGAPGAGESVIRNERYSSRGGAAAIPRPEIELVRLQRLVGYGFHPGLPRGVPRAGGVVIVLICARRSPGRIPRPKRRGDRATPGAVEQRVEAWCGGRAQPSSRPPPT